MEEWKKLSRSFIQKNMDRNVLNLDMILRYGRSQ